MTPFYIIIITAFLVFSCSSDKPSATAAKGSSDAGSAAPGAMRQPGPSAGALYDLELTPKEPTRKSTVGLRPTGFDLSGAKIEWMVNGRSFTTLVPDQFSGADAAKGSSIQARAVVQGREVLSDSVQLVNAPPEITRVRLLPEIFKPGDALSVDVEGNDVDGDKVTFLYEWKRNGELAGALEKIGGTVRRGDQVSVAITPFDGESYGLPVVLKREILNLPPMITNHNEFTFDGKVYSYQIKAEDPDGDALTYSSAPVLKGMTIDPSTGILRWNVPADFQGTQDVSIMVSDGHGGTSTYSITITIR